VVAVAPAFATAALLHYIHYPTNSRSEVVAVVRGNSGSVHYIHNIHTSITSKRFAQGKTRAVSLCSAAAAAVAVVAAMHVAAAAVVSQAQQYLHTDARDTQPYGAHTLHLQSTSISLPS
jgi:hypothetical protein